VVPPFRLPGTKLLSSLVLPLLPPRTGFFRLAAVICLEFMSPSPPPLLFDSPQGKHVFFFRFYTVFNNTQERRGFRIFLVDYSAQIEKIRRFPTRMPVFFASEHPPSCLPPPWQSFPSPPSAVPQSIVWPLRRVLQSTPSPSTGLKKL